jgi:ribosomal subunit interface protein
MMLTVTGRRLTVADRTRAQIERHVRRLEKVLHGRAVSAHCVLSEERGRHVCELTIRVGGRSALHGLGRDGRAVGAVSRAVEKVELQATRLADRQRGRRRQAES